MLLNRPKCHICEVGREPPSDVFLCLVPNWAGSFGIGHMDVGLKKFKYVFIMINNVKSVSDT